MAELIDKGALVGKVCIRADYEFNDTRRNAYKEFWDMISSMPTTTEAEIRASVIDEALKALSIFNDREHGNEHFIYGIETAKDILEQLKERD